MCGRYVSTSTPDEIAEYFEAESNLERALEPSWNVAPTDDVYIVRTDDEGKRQVAAHHWGLVPFWAKSPSVGAKMINTRSEGIAEKGASKYALRHRRCLVPADGFYEWKEVPGQKAKQPYFIHRADGAPMAFAGLWEEWRSSDDPQGGALRTASIITTTPNEVMEPIHDRMPVILEPDAWGGWLESAEDDVEALTGLLVPAGPGVLAMHPVGRDVGNVRNNEPSLVDPVEEPPSQPTLV